MSEPLTVARIEDGIVVNIEVVTDEWLNGSGAEGLTFVPITDQPAYIGLHWDVLTGFEQPPMKEVTDE